MAAAEPPPEAEPASPGTAAPAGLLHLLDHGGRRAVYSVAFSPCGGTPRILTGCDDGKARVFDALDARLLQVLDHTGPVLSVGFSPCGTHILTGCDDRRARVFFDLAVVWCPKNHRLFPRNYRRTARLLLLVFRSRMVDSRLLQSRLLAMMHAGWFIAES